MLDKLHLATVITAFAGGFDPFWQLRCAQGKQATWGKHEGVAAMQADSKFAATGCRRDGGFGAAEAVASAHTFPP